MLRRVTSFMFALLLLGAWLAWAAPGAGAAEPEQQAGSEPQEQQLTLDQAISKALAHSRALEKARLDVQKAEENRDLADEALGFTPTAGGSYDPRVEAAWYNLLSKDLTWQMSRRQVDQAEDVLVLQVCKLYWDVQAAQEKLALATKAAAQAELEARLAQVGYQAGVRSKTEADLAEQKRRQAQADAAKAEQDLRSAYLKFNSAVGLDLEARPALVEHYQFSPLEVTDLQHEIARVLAESPAVWLAEQQVTMQHYAQEMAFASGSYRPYEVRKIDRRQAELDAADAREQAAQTVRTLYITVRSLEESYRKAQAQVAQAAEDLRVTRVRYQVGMATQAEVQAKELALAQAELAANELLRQHAYYKLVFQKPWAMGGS